MGFAQSVGLRPSCSMSCSSHREETPTRVRFQPTHDPAGWCPLGSFLPAGPALPRSRRSQTGGNQPPWTATSPHKNGAPSASPGPTASQPNGERMRGAVEGAGGGTP